MSIPPYVQGFPQDGSSLGNTRVQIRNNLDGTFLTLAVDHEDNNGNPGSGTPGYHKVIHFQDQGTSTPATVAGVTQEYTNTDSHTIQQIKLKSTGGNVYQQTTMLDAYISRFGDDLSVNLAGWTYLPGGLIMNYGYTTNAPTGLVVDFPTLGLPNFSNANYIVDVTPIERNLSGKTLFAVSNAALTVSSFTINAQTNTINFYWKAVGKPA